MSTVSLCLPCVLMFDLLSLRALRQMKEIMGETRKEGVKLSVFSEHRTPSSQILVGHACNLLVILLARHSSVCRSTCRCKRHKKYPTYSKEPSKKDSTSRVRPLGLASSFLPCLSAMFLPSLPFSFGNEQNNSSREFMPSGGTL